jgi:hypothetical protein
MSSRPIMPPLQPGDRLTYRPNLRRARKDTEVVVTRVGRIYAYASIPEYAERGYTGDEYKFNKTTGHIHGGNYSSPGRMLTQAQVEWHERAKAAEDYLTGEHFKGIWDLRPRWREDLVTLANLLRAHDGLDPL